jgi:hypothetical protein
MDPVELLLDGAGTADGALPAMESALVASTQALSRKFILSRLIDGLWGICVRTTGRNPLSDSMKRPPIACQLRQAA